MKMVAEPFKDLDRGKVPQWILKGEPEVRREFIRGFFDAEGWYHIRPESSDYRVRFGQANEEILREIHKILTREGFKCSEVLGPYKSKPDVKPYYELHIYGRNQMYRFHKLIKPHHPDKQLDFKNKV